METQINTFIPLAGQNKIVSIFGYSSRAMPSLEINGIGHLAKNLKEKIIYLTRTRKLQVPQKRFVICVDAIELAASKQTELKWLEFPILLCFWHLSGILPIHKLDDCLTSGTVSCQGEVRHLPFAKDFYPEIIQSHMIEAKKLKHITNENTASPFSVINSQLLLEHVPKMKFCDDYIESSSAIPSKPFIT
ncbi:MAG: hypothetical protein CME62_14235 [Halobacteriovoraceae bacterium]|nr:hypothetical protein [Halobacteriovoraceae bacterium]